MKKRTLITALMLTLSMGLMVGCGETKEKKDAVASADDGNAKLAEMRSIDSKLSDKGVSPTSLWGTTSAKIKIQNTKDVAVLTETKAQLEKYVTLGYEVLNLANRKGVTMTGKDSHVSNIRAAEDLRDACAAQIKSLSTPTAARK